MKQIIVDAGPLIAVFNLRDTQHQSCVAKFKQLIKEKYILITTFPVLCEIHKIIQQYAGAKVAQKALNELLEGIEIIPFEIPAIEDTITLLISTPEWQGTLQDASVIILALQLKLPVWTLDYRDFSRFPKVELWN